MNEKYMHQAFDDAYIYAQLALAPEQSALAMHQYMRKEALEAFELWKVRKHKMPY